MSMVDTGHTDVETLVSTKLLRCWVVHPPPRASYLATYIPMQLGASHAPVWSIRLFFLPGFASNESPETKHKKLAGKKKTKKGGGAGYRSLCLVHAKHALYHLSYTPSIHSQAWRRPTRLTFAPNASRASSRRAEEGAG